MQYITFDMCIIWKTIGFEYAENTEQYYNVSVKGVINFL